MPMQLLDNEINAVIKGLGWDPPLGNLIVFALIEYFCYPVVGKKAGV